MTKGKITSVADYIDRQIDISGVPQKEIAAALGYSNANVITMFKQGRTKLPITKVGPLAKVLGVDTVHLLRIVMNEYMPETYAALEEMIGQSLVTEGEMQVIRIIRENAGDKELALTRAEHRNMLAKVIRDIANEENPTTVRAPAAKK